MNTILSRFVGLILGFLPVVSLAHDKITGNASVSATGAAVYSINVEMPEGYGGFKPSLGITYNSQTGNGLAGWGCNVTGFSSITRGVMDLWHDNMVYGVRYVKQDAYYLDGKRLILKSGGAGLDGAVYAPDGEPFTEVTFHGGDNSIYFTVDTGDGMTYEYGRTSAACQTADNPSAIAAWYVNKATNALGQTIIYSYSKNAHYLYPNTISYGGDNLISFEYESRPDTIPFMIRDNRGYVTQRLKSITCSTTNCIFRKYSFSYYNNTEANGVTFSRIKKITEAGKNGQSSLKINAYWNTIPNFSPLGQAIDIDIEQDSPLRQYGERAFTAGDLNGDGISDIISISSVNIYQTIGQYTSGSLYTSAQIYKSKSANGSISYEGPVEFLSGELAQIDDWTCQKGSLMAVDINGGGIKDLILPIGDNATVNGLYSLRFKYVLGEDIATGGGSFRSIPIPLSSATEMPLYTISDFDNNGKGDILVLEKQQYGNRYPLHLTTCNGPNSATTQTFSLTLSSAPKRLFCSDFNNDGLTDIIVVSNSGYRIYYNQGSSVQGMFQDCSTLNTHFANHPFIEAGDFNGDGTLDFLWINHNSNTVYFELGNGNGTFTSHQAYVLPVTVRQENSSNGTCNIIATDLDHDGKTDVVLSLANYNGYTYLFEKTYTYWLLSKGSSLSLLKSASSTRETDAKAGHIFVGDFKGRGFGEIANYGYDCYSGNNANVAPTMYYYCSNTQHINNGTISYFTDSDGRKATFNYCSLPAVYLRGTSRQYPLIDIAAPIRVATHLDERGGSSIINTTNFTYKGLVAHQQGRGLLGFQEITAEESTSGKTVKTTTVYDTECYLPTLTTVTTTQGGYTATSVSTMTPVQYSYRNYMLYPTQQENTDIYGNTTTATRTYDTQRGRLSTERTEYDNSNMFKQVTYGYPTAKIAGAWRPQTVTAVQKHSDGDIPFTSQTNITYNANGLKTTIVESANTSLALTKAYQYDSYGNVTQETLTGNGISTPVVTNYQYSNGKFLSQRSDAAGVTSYTYNVFGEMISMTDNQLTTSYTYNDFGTLTHEANQAGNSTSYTYSSTTDYNAAYSLKISSFGKPTETRWYDTFGNELRTYKRGITDTSVSTTTSYDAKGRVTEMTSRHGDLTITDSYSYDGLGRMAEATSTNGKSTRYSYGNRTVTTTENGRQYAKTFDAWGNVKTSTDPEASVSYTYHSNGKPSAVTTGSNAVAITYDAAGNQTSLNDPDAGLTSYQHDAMHRIRQQTDAKGCVTAYTYDAASRLSSKAVGAATTNYTYGTASNGSQQLLSEQTGDRTISYTYDSYGRLSQVSHAMSGENPLVFSYAYDNYNRLASKTFPQGVTVSYVYDIGYRVASKMGTRNISVITKDNGIQTIRKQGGTLTSVHSSPNSVTPIGDGISQPQGGGLYPPGTVVDTLVNKPLEPIGPAPIDPWDGPVSARYGALNPATVHTSSFDYRGFITSLTTKHSTATLREMDFTLQDGTGNLLSRSGMTDQSESFAYDNIDRLTSVTVDGVLRQSISYDTSGNIITKTGLGTYTYTLDHPHAVTSVAYPSSGISAASQSVTYTDFGKVASITDGNYSMSFTYGPDGQRWKTVLRHNGSVERTTLYAGDYERITENGTTYHLYYLDGGVIYVLEEGETEGDFYYSNTDHLGSIVDIFNESGTSVFKANYDAWGKQTVTIPNTSFAFHRGYTGHEMLPEFGLINMNGRLYDPILGRFLSPDNYVQLPDFSQSFNRYSYCINNPLKYNDPSGEFWHLILGAMLGGTMNLIMNAPNVGNFWQGLGYFSIGATAGALSAGIGSGVNVAMAGGSFGAGFMGTAAGISSTGFIAGAITGAASGFTGGFVTCTGNAWINGANLGDGLAEGFKGGSISTITSGIIGGVIGGFNALGKGANFWTGKASFNLSEAYCAHGFKVGENTITGEYVGEFEGINVFENETFLGDISEGGNLRGATFPGRGILVSKGVYTLGKPDGKALLQHEFGHILQYREVGAKAYYSIIAPESFASATRSQSAHDHFWTETWANYLSKGYFGNKWYGNQFNTYYAENIGSFNRLRLYIARYSPFMPF